MPTMLTLLTAADQTYFRCLWQLIRSLLRSPEARACRLWVYDLGLRPEQKRQLQRAFAAQPQIEWRAFELERFPAYFQPAARTYAWKPALIAEALEELQGKVLWLDSANLVLGSLQPVSAWLDAHGLYTPYSSGAADCTLGAWTHPATLAALRVEPAVRRKRQRAGSVCGFNGQFPAVRELVRAWRECAWQPDCLAPAGASVAGRHRFDESVLTILVYQFAERYGLRLTSDELNLNSAHPIPWLSARHKVGNRLPTGLDFAAWRYFWLMRQVDIFSNRWRAYRARRA